MNAESYFYIKNNLYSLIAELRLKTSFWCRTANADNKLNHNKNVVFKFYIVSIINSFNFIIFNWTAGYNNTEISKSFDLTNSFKSDRVGHHQELKYWGRERPGELYSLNSNYLNDNVFIDRDINHCVN